MSYRLLAIDLDGTTSLDGQLPSPAVSEALAAASAQGVTVVIATGRSFYSIQRYAAALGLGGPAICYQGALVKELSGAQHTLMAEAMPRPALLELLAEGERRGLEMSLYSEREMYVATMRQTQAYYDLWFGIPMQRVANLAEGLRRIEADGLAPLKVLVVGEPEDNDLLTGQLAGEFSDRLEVVRSHPFFIEAVCPGTSKARALAFLAERLGVSRSETMAVGDSGNDISMIRWAGLGVAMGNATADVLAASDWVAPQVQHDGLAVAVDQFILRSGRRAGGEQWTSILAS